MLKSSPRGSLSSLAPTHFHLLIIVRSSSPSSARPLLHLLLLLTVSSHTLLLIWALRPIFSPFPTRPSVTVIFEKALDYHVTVASSAEQAVVFSMPGTSCPCRLCSDLHLNLNQPEESNSVWQAVEEELGGRDLRTKQLDQD